MSESAFGFIAAGGAVFLAVVLWMLYSGYREAKGQEAVEYLLQVVENARVYFHGQPAEKCMRENIVWEMRWHEVGDFARQFGGLVLYALHVKGDSSARIYWRNCWDETTRHEYCAVFVRFKYGRSSWLYDVQNPDFGENSVRRMKKRKEFAEFVEYEYKDLSRIEQRIMESCTDPTRSMLAPDFHYSGAGDAHQYEDAFRHALQMIMRE